MFCISFSVLGTYLTPHCAHTVWSTLMISLTEGLFQKTEPSFTVPQHPVVEDIIMEMPVSFLGRYLRRLLVKYVYVLW